MSDQESEPPNNNDGTGEEEREQQRGDNIGICNTVLAYIQYGLSSATPDNVIEVVCTHFSPEEITGAKDKLWRSCDLGGPPPRNNSKGRKAAEAPVQDIITEICKLDREDYVFFVESGGIARLPRFNAESLNVVAPDQRIADLSEECFSLRIEMKSYRNNYLQSQHQLSLMQTVLQQHTDALRDLRNVDGTFGANFTGIHHPFEFKSDLSAFGRVTTNTTTPNKNRKCISMTSSPTRNDGSPKQSPSLPTPPSSSLKPSSQLSVSSPSTLPSPHTSKQAAPSGGSAAIKPLSGAPLYSNVATKMSTRSPASNSHVASPLFLSPVNSTSQSGHLRTELGRPYQQSIIQPRDCSVPGSDIHPEVGNDGFQKNKHDIKKDRKREQFRKKVVYGTKRTTDSRISDGPQSTGESKCDLFIYHVPHRSTVGGLRGYLADNNIDTGDLRIDITSHELSMFKSFRLIGPSRIRAQLLTPDFWPVDVRVKEYQPVKRNRDNIKRGFQPRQRYNN